MTSGVYQRRLKPIQERLFAKVVKTSTCWLWTGGTGDFGHGHIQNGHYKPERPFRYRIGTHRVSYELKYGPVPDGLCVLHKCDVPQCVNPDHLFLGTKADNMRDMISKGRMKLGHQLPQTKLSIEQVLAIRASKNISQAALAAQYGVSQPLICAIKTGKRRVRALQQIAIAYPNQP